MNGLMAARSAYISTATERALFRYADNTMRRWRLFRRTTHGKPLIRRRVVCHKVVQLLPLKVERSTLLPFIISEGIRGLVSQSRLSRAR
jgi:hypothetical protein